jgi:hypothetical protein
VPSRWGVSSPSELLDFVQQRQAWAALLAHRVRATAEKVLALQQTMGVTRALNECQVRRGSSVLVFCEISKSFYINVRLLLRIVSAGSRTTSGGCED